MMQQELNRLREAWLELVRVIIKESKFEKLINFLGLKLKDKYKEK